MRTEFSSHHHDHNATEHDKAHSTSWYNRIACFIYKKNCQHIVLTVKKLGTFAEKKQF